jgi:archaeal flagellar protein FlaF
MAAASLVGSAIGIILLIVTAYVLVAGALTVSQVAISAQTDMTGVQKEILGTSLSITNSSSNQSSPIILVLNNTGREVIRPITKMDVFGYESTPGKVRYQYSRSGSSGTWQNGTIMPDTINPNLWDPDESLTITIVPNASGTVSWVQVTTPNGISASKYLYP